MRDTQGRLRPTNCRRKATQETYGIRLVTLREKMGEFSPSCCCKCQEIAQFIGKMLAFATLSGFNAISMKTLLGGVALGVAADLSKTRVSLLQRIREDDRDQHAWREFVGRYGKQIYEWCAHRGLQPCDAEDVTQEVLTKLAKKLGSFEYDPDSTFRGWLRRITENAIVDFLRDCRRRGQSKVEYNVDEILGTVEARSELIEKLEKAFDLELLDVAKSRIRSRVDIRRWKAWELTALHHCDGPTVAKQLEMKLPTVYSSRYQVQKMISEELVRLESETASQLYAGHANDLFRSRPK